ncbi:MAG: NIPSNAP family protein [Akkermansiaceae bacterium]
MKKILALLALLAGPLSAEVYEMRTYFANEGKMEGLLARFRDHTTKIFETHGMKNIGYWLTDEDEPKLVYIISHKDRETAKKNWKAFVADPKWKKAKSASEVDGKLVKKVISQFMTATDFSAIK